jgi:chaperone required for assembly of F1-ATPase
MLSAPRRFYKSVTVEQGEDGWRVLLDGKRLRSPAKLDFAMPTRALAEAIAAEWDAQSERVDPHSMPMMQLAATAVDRIAADRDRIIAETAAYAGSDLVCYRADAPAELARRQDEVWQPLVAWVAERYDVALNVTAGIVAVAQPPHALAAFRRVLEAADLFSLAALATLTGAAGSLVIALALAEGRLTAEQAAAAALLDELFQAERWGSDPEAEARRAGVRRDLTDGLRFHRLSRP